MRGSIEIVVALMYTLRYTQSLYVDYVDVPVTEDVLRVSTEAGIRAWVDNVSVEAGKIGTFAVNTEKRVLNYVEKVGEVAQTASNLALETPDTILSAYHFVTRWIKVAMVMAITVVVTMLLCAFRKYFDIVKRLLHRSHTARAATSP